MRGMKPNELASKILLLTAIISAFYPAVGISQDIALRIVDFILVSFTLYVSFED